MSSSLGRDAPKVTIIRPVKGLEPQLYECIASTFRQDYPSKQISVRLCIAEKTDPAYLVLQKLVEDFPHFDTQVLVETDDPLLHGSGGHVDNLGPNPKIRNISRAYREAEGDVIWIIDCNVWVAGGVLGRMVDKLTGRVLGNRPARPYKFVHQLPLEVDLVDYSKDPSADSQGLLSSHSEASPTSDLSAQAPSHGIGRIYANAGGRLDEMFMATTHAKFYGAINVVGIAPCIVGKSNMFRKSHLDRVTDPALNPILPKDDSRPSGIDYFSHNICEDHLIGDLLWRSDLDGFANHGIAWGDLVLQPMAGMSVPAYVARRVRWLRARKFTVLAATLVEPGVESLLCCAYFAFAVTTLPWVRETFDVSPTWKATGAIWLSCVFIWMTVDWIVYGRLHSGLTIDDTPHTPFFAKGMVGPGGSSQRSLLQWMPAWFGREIMALPIWTWAVLFGVTVNWRGKSFRVRPDARVFELHSGNAGISRNP